MKLQTNKIKFRKRTKSSKPCANSFNWHATISSTIKISAVTTQLHGNLAEYNVKIKNTIFPKCDLTLTYTQHNSKQFSKKKYKYFQRQMSWGYNESLNQRGNTLAIET